MLFEMFQANLIGFQVDLINKGIYQQILNPILCNILNDFFPKINSGLKLLKWKISKTKSNLPQVMGTVSYIASSNWIRYCAKKFLGCPENSF